MKRFWFLLLVPMQFAFAQIKPTQVFTYVEQMPELPGGGGNAAIVNAIMKRLQVTKAVLEASNRTGATRSLDGKQSFRRLGFCTIVSN